MIARNHIRAARYRALALTETDQARANLLDRLATEAEHGVLCRSPASSAPGVQRGRRGWRQGCLRPGMSLAEEVPPPCCRRVSQQYAFRHEETGSQHDFGCC